MSDIDQKTALSIAAEVLLRDETLARALDDMRAVGLDSLLNTPAEDMPAIMRWQAYVAAVDAFRGQLRVYFDNGKPQKPRGSVA